MRLSTFLVSAVGLVLAAPASAMALAPTTATPERPLLEAPARGAAAVRALGQDLDDAAARSGLTAADLEHTLRSDRTAWVDDSGRLFFVDGFTDLDAAATAAAAAPAADASTGVAAAYPYAQTFQLHSRPNATRVIYLDFDGYDLHDTAWNAAGTPALSVPAYTTDADPAFSTAELDTVQEVWARVSEDYAPFNVDVTTQDPGTAGLARTSATDAAYGVRASISTQASLRSSISGCGGTCAGVAYIGNFDTVLTANQNPEYYQPAFALPTTSYSAAFVAEIVSHEVGHTLGLSHDGQGSGTYYQDPNGTQIWSPIMGAGYTPLTQFSNGDYAGATQTQDDFALIAQNGTPVLADDYGNTTATAAPVASGAAVAGLVETRGDVDVFRVDRTCAGPLTTTVTPAAQGADLDTQLRLLDAAGTPVAVAAPASARAAQWSPVVTGLDATITQTLPTGTYYVEVSGVGLDNAALGYSDYGSVGRYTLSVGACVSTPVVVTPTTVTPTPTTPSTTPVTGGSTGTGNATVPSSPLIAGAKPGRAGGATTVGLDWARPASSGGASLTGYVLTIWKVSKAHRLVRVRTDHLDPMTHRTVLRLGKGAYRFAIAAANTVGTGPQSAKSAVVHAR